MQIHGERPRELHWYHAGPMLFGDWGTSRLYVLGLAFFYTRHASFWFMLAMSALLVSVGWAYQVICRIYPDGGGVYSSARHRSEQLAVIGGLLLCADYLVTASISSLDAFHYLNVPQPHVWAIVSIAGVGAINIFGPRKAGTLALIVALLTVLLTLITAGFAGPALKTAVIEKPTGGPIEWWAQFTSLILAISGVEAIANMTGIMVRPVDRTARRAIWPVLIEIVVLNLVLTLAMLALPLEVLGGGDPTSAHIAHRDDMMRLLAEYYVGPRFAAGASLVFAGLLLSAVNTAVTDLVSIQFMMARDHELPSFFGMLNKWGMPGVPLFFATLIPLIIVWVLPDVAGLANLYAIGVVGAVAINLATTATSWNVVIGRWERAGMTALSVLMVAIWITIAWEKPDALLFAMTIMLSGLTARAAVRHRDKIRKWMLEPVHSPIVVETAAKAEVIVAPPPVPRLAERGTEGAAAPVTRMLVATRGNVKLFDFALDEAANRHAELFVLFIRHIAVATMGPSNVANADEDPEAKELFLEMTRAARAREVQMHCLYAVAWDVAEAILDIAVTHSIDVLILGASERGALWRAMKGDVIQEVARYLPERINLLIHA